MSGTARTDAATEDGAVDGAPRASMGGAPGPGVGGVGEREGTPDRAAAAGAGRAGAGVGGAAVAGFWLPAELRARLIASDTQWQEVRFAKGRECGADCAADAPGAVAARWPLLTQSDWAELLSGLQDAREKAPCGTEYWTRFRDAMGTVARRLSQRTDPYHQALTETIPSYTGYSPGMLAATIGSPDLWDLGKMVPALRYQPPKACGARWQKMPELPGRVRFFPRKAVDQVAGWVPVAWEMPLFREDTLPRSVLGYAGGNVPGGALMMIILALSATLRGEAQLSGPEPPPVTLIRSSARESLLAPLVLSALEEADPALVSMIATTVWDLDDDALEERLLGDADVVLAAAGDNVIGRLSGRLASAPGRRRFHAHGPKVSFTAIGREVLRLYHVQDTLDWNLPGGTEIIDIVALLAGLDSAFWDQNGCPSSRVHFVEKEGPTDDLPAEYARRLTARLRQISMVAPRGAWPVRSLHDPFDRYKAIEGSTRWGTGLQVISDYDDPFVVVLDDRTGDESRLDPSVFASVVNECRSRVIVVRPVGDIMEVAWRYLDMLPRHSLQSLSVAMGRPGEGLSRQFLDFATACASRGVTALRVVGRGSFPQPAYSWDGLLPLDLVGERPPGYFSTIEFDSPFDEMIRTYRTHVAHLATIPPVDKGGLVTPLRPHQ
jgi:hypothetical protein